MAGLSSLEGILCAHTLGCWHWAPGEVFGPVCVSCEYLSRLVSVPDPGAPLGEHRVCLSGARLKLSSLPSGAAPGLTSSRIALCPQGPQTQAQILNGREAFVGTKNVTYPVSQIGPWAGLEGQRL